MSVRRRKSRAAEHDWLERLEPRQLLSSWFVSAKSGSEANPGSLAQPFATIQKAADVAQAGDTIFIRAGVYRETVVPARSGAAGAPIMFRPYNNESVTINGADVLNGLARLAHSIAQVPMARDLGAGQNQIFLDGQMLTEARWPNTPYTRKPNFFRNAFAQAAGVSVEPPDSSRLSTATISVPQLNDPPGAWMGATIHIAPGQGWVFETGTVIASAPGSLTYTFQQLQPADFQVPAAGNHFYLTGKMQALDAPGEWFRDPSSAMLDFVRPRSSNLRGHLLEAKRRLYAFDLSGPWQDQFHPHTTGIILNGTFNTIRDSTIQ